MSVSILAILGLIVGILLAIEAGRRARRWRQLPENVSSISPTIQASIFGLMGLLIGFTFYGAGSRFDIRRNLTAQEANAIGTAYLRLDLLPPEAQPSLREDFRNYVSSRLALFHSIPDVKAANAELDRSAALQRQIWRKAVEAVKSTGPADKTLVLSSLNEMIDITTVVTVSFMTHPPAAVFVMLAFSVITCSALAGYEMSGHQTRDWVSALAFAITVGVAVYVIVDYEYPRVGLLRVDPADQVLVDTLNKMK